MMKNIPNFITSLNLTSGFVAIIFASTGDILTASWILLAAMIFDFLDGFSARMLKAYSAIGKELDSLADVVSFGVAPGIIIYELLNRSLGYDTTGTVDTKGIIALFILIIPAIMPACAAIRLAVFNLDTTQTTSFKGLPTPANAIAVISIVIADHFTQSEILHNIISSPYIIIPITVILSILMVTRLPLFSLKVSNLRLKGNEGRYLLLILILVSLIIFGMPAVILVIPFYLIASALSLLF